MADHSNNPFAFIARLPDAVITQPFEKHPGIFIQAALIEGPGRNIFIECVFGPEVPQVTYTLNVGGRGALVFGEQEFRDIASASLALFEVRQSESKSEPTPRAEAALPVLPDTLSGGTAD